MFMSYSPFFIDFAFVFQQDRGINGLRKSTRDASEGSKDYSLLVYSSLLQNEVLGASIEDFKEASEERRALSPVPTSKNLFSVMMPHLRFSWSACLPSIYFHIRIIE